ncbi:MAG: ice-binding family protein [Candidatus Cryosericum sp.]
MRRTLAVLVVLSLLMSMFTGVFVSMPRAAAAGSSAVNLGTSENFAILAKTGISTTGVTHVTGDIGVSPAAASTITGFALIADASNVFSTSAQVTGKAYASDYAPPTPANMTTAISNMETAYTDAAGRTPGVGPFLNIGAGTVAGQTLVPGVYTWGSNVTITTDLSLSGGANDVWIFQISGTLDIATGMKVLLTGGAQAKNIFWQVADAVTLKPSSHIEGIILAKTNIAMQNGATLNGRALAQTAVTLIAATVSAPASVPPVPTPKADLVVTKSVNNQAPPVGSQVVFTVHVQNAGPDAATNVVVNDVLPNGLTYVSSPVTQGTYASGSGIWTVGTLTNGQGATLTMTATVQASANRTNTAVGSATETDPNLVNNTATATINPTAAVAGPRLNPLALPPQISRESELVVDEGWTDGTAPFSWTVNFGDGTPVVTGTSTDRRLIVRHLYAAEGTYTVGVTVTDFTGKTDSTSQALKAVNTTVPEQIYHHTFFIGYPDGMFKPDRSVSRAEVAAALTRALGLGWSSTIPSYSDVPATHWAAGYIQIMAAEGIMMGDASGTFRPDAFITRAEAAAALLRMLKVEPFHNLTSSSFKDVAVTNWALGYIESMQKYGLIGGYPDGTYKPDAHILRSEFTAIADRALGREIISSSQITGLAGSVLWPDVPANHWAYLYILEASTPHTVAAANRVNRTIVLKTKTLPLFSDGTSTITVRKVGDSLTAIVPVDGLRSDGTAPAARKVTVIITIKLTP